MHVAQLLYTPVLAEYHKVIETRLPDMRGVRRFLA
jgi:hypothetical protein